MWLANIRSVSENWRHLTTRCEATRERKRPGNDADGEQVCRTEFVLPQGTGTHSSLDARKCASDYHVQSPAILWDGAQADHCTFPELFLVPSGPLSAGEVLGRVVFPASVLSLDLSATVRALLATSFLYRQELVQTSRRAGAGWGPVKRGGGVEESQGMLVWLR
ncbi:hypothetical protein CC79DRAFT_1056962 [Sarocladium strictum]